MALATLTIDLVAKLASLERDMGKAAQIAERNAKRMDEAFSRVKTSLAAIGSVLTVGAFAGMVRSVADAGDKLQKLSTKTGATVEELSKLQYAASLSDLSNEDLGASLVKLNKVMGEAADGSKTATEALARFGIAPESGLSTVEALRQIADKVKATGDETKVASALNDVFGKSFASLIPLLKGGSEGMKESADELERMGGVMSGDLAEASEKFNDNMTRLNTQLEALKIQTIGPLIPLFEQMTTAMSNSSDKANSLAESGGVLKTVFETVAVLGANVYYVVKQTGSEIGGMAAQLKALSTLDFDAFSAIGDSMKEDAKKARAEVDALTYRILNSKAVLEASKIKDSWLPAQSTSGGGISSTPTSTPKQKTCGSAKAERFDLSQFDALIKAEESYLQALEGIAAAQESARRSTLGLTEAQSKLLDLKQSGVWLTLSVEQQKAAEDQARYADETIRSAESQERLNALIGGLESSQIEQAWQDMELLNQALDRGAISQEQYAEAVNKVFDTGSEKIKEQKSMAEELGLTFSSAFEEAIVKGEKFSDVLQGIGEDILRIMVRQNITNPLTESVGKIDFSSLFSGFSLPSFAVGTNYVPQDMIAQIHKGEKIVPAKYNNDSSGVSVVINNSMADQAQATVQPRMNNGKLELEVLIQQVLSKDMQQNGRITQGLSHTFGLARAV